MPAHILKLRRIARETGVELVREVFDLGSRVPVLEVENGERLVAEPLLVHEGLERLLGGLGCFRSRGAAQGLELFAEVVSVVLDARDDRAALHASDVELSLELKAAGKIPALLDRERFVREDFVENEHRERRLRALHLRLLAASQGLDLAAARPAPFENVEHFAPQGAALDGRLGLRIPGPCSLERRDFRHDGGAHGLNGLHLVLARGEHGVVRPADEPAHRIDQVGAEVVGIFFLRVGRPRPGGRALERLHAGDAVGAVEIAHHRRQILVNGHAVVRRRKPRADVRKFALSAEALRDRPQVAPDGAHLPRALESRADQGFQIGERADVFGQTLGKRPEGHAFLTACGVKRAHERKVRLLERPVGAAPLDEPFKKLGRGDVPLYAQARERALRVDRLHHAHDVAPDGEALVMRENEVRPAFGRVFEACGHNARVERRMRDHQVVEALRELGRERSFAREARQEPEPIGKGRVPERLERRRVIARRPHEGLHARACVRLERSFKRCKRLFKKRALELFAKGLEVRLKGRAVGLGQAIVGKRPPFEKRRIAKRVEVERRERLLGRPDHAPEFGKGLRGLRLEPHAGFGLRVVGNRHLVEPLRDVGQGRRIEPRRRGKVKQRIKGLHVCRLIERREVRDGLGAVGLGEVRFGPGHHEGGHALRRRFVKPFRLKSPAAVSFNPCLKARCERIAELPLGRARLRVEVMNAHVEAVDDVVKARPNVVGHKRHVERGKFVSKALELKGGARVELRFSADRMAREDKAVLGAREPLGQ